PEDVFLCSVAITNLWARPQQLTLVLWTAQPRGPAGSDQALHLDLPASDNPAAAAPFTFTRGLPGGGVRATHTVAFALGADRAPASFAVNHSEWSTGRANHPRWELTPFYENAQAEAGYVRLPNTRKA